MTNKNTITTQEHQDGSSTIHINGTMRGKYKNSAEVLKHAALLLEELDLIYAERDMWKETAEKLQEKTNEND